MEKIPILKINNILIVSLQGDLTDRSIVNFQQDILEKIYKNKAVGVLIDISVLDIIDSFLGRVISDTARMIRLLGSEIMIVGMKPCVAITLVELGLEIGSVNTALDMESGIEKLKREIKSQCIEEVDESALTGRLADDGLDGNDQLGEELDDTL
ncbi:STAS domain-containing protein [Pseudobacteroides cellulosolvens]|uniref:Anti-sigma-factor antagonist n=1 Tax=Pseudobacteroides cellulosolvens ATCC 35603 = DSM 2933 TaxID=398512 RepID=A0A0L6JKL5_9FIRM|nr:STAS domain-containing protein [Pseudobacteroides cellulosolvens]KNY26295.1 anti-sigma-factor antagonist [Pseudobacteroides cellulosolvens ATCC 35603 = DSM 2933]